MKIPNSVFHIKKNMSPNERIIFQRNTNLVNFKNKHCDERLFRNSDYLLLIMRVRENFN